jgi:Nickel responsive protein SCO4226-like
MKRFIIERKLPGAGDMTPEEIKAISKTSVDVITAMGKAYSWVQSFVTEDKIYCIHIAENKDDIRTHAKCGNIPVNSIEEIKCVIDPSTAG